MMFYTLQKIMLMRGAHFLNIYYHTSFQDPILNYVSVAPISQIFASTMLMLAAVAD
jgi:hypothetical protein